MGVVAQALSKPFDCGAYGELCDALDPAAAKQYVCGVWNNLSDHESVATTMQQARAVLDEHLTDCTPDLETCEEICSKTSGEVLRCEGYSWAGVCHSIPLCSSFTISEIPYFEFLGPGPI